LMVTFTTIYAICSNIRVKCTGLEKNHHFKDVFKNQTFFYLNRFLVFFVQTGYT